MVDWQGLYAIVDPDRCTRRDPEQLARAILSGGCGVLQLRAKLWEDARVLDLARRLAGRCRAAGVPFVVNDRADLALLSSADGVHLGQEDLPIDCVRSLAPGLRVGISTHNAVQVADAVAAGADLIGFGPVFPTRSKANPDPVVGLDGLAEAVRSAGVPVVAIGGLDIESAPLARRAGARLVAVISALADAEQPERYARELHRALIEPGAGG